MIPPAQLARIAVPTTLIRGRHDRLVRLGVAQAASARYGWPLRDQTPPTTPPPNSEAFLRALSGALVPVASSPRRQP